MHRFSLALSLATSCAVELSIPHIIQLCGYCLIHEITPSMSRLAQNWRDALFPILFLFIRNFNKWNTFNNCSAIYYWMHVCLAPMLYGLRIRTLEKRTFQLCSYTSTHLYTPVRNLDSVPGTEANGSSSFCETSPSLWRPSITTSYIFVQSAITGLIFLRLWNLTDCWTSAAVFVLALPLSKSVW